MHRLEALWPHSREFVLYGAVSGAGLAVDLALLIGLTELVGIPYLLSAAIGFTMGAVVVYALSIGWVFQARTYRDRPANEFILFVMIGIAGLILNQAILYAGTDMIGAHYTFSKMVAIGFVFSWNFGARKMLLFTREAHP
ncbi:MAG: GtrA family protein [Alphaproteobacteria bacterium]|jgi:putative flippase GtrA|nr:GtrA family protein [Alphaproteobacteria bacterium]